MTNDECLMTNQGSGAFTLIELLVVITIIVILMGLLFPAFRGVQDQAKRTQAKNDLTQIVTAVNAFYTEYGKYPLATQSSSDQTLPGDAAQEDLMDTLRGNNATLNPRIIVFFSPPDAKDKTNPRSGIGSDRKFYDPWGKQYFVAIDGDYDNSISASKHGYADLSDVRNGVIAWSYGKDGAQGDKIKADQKFKDSDDVISWQ